MVMHKFVPPPPPHDETLVARTMCTFLRWTQPIVVELKWDPEASTWRIVVSRWEWRDPEAGNGEWQVDGYTSTWFSANEQGEAMRYYRAKAAEALHINGEHFNTDHPPLRW